MGMGLKPQALLAAVACSDGDLGKTFTAGDLLIQAWLRNRAVWGLRGYENQHASSDKIYEVLNRPWRIGLVGMGLLEQVNPLVFRLRPVEACLKQWKLAHEKALQSELCAVPV
jgi:hypothetical protein